MAGWDPDDVVVLDEMGANVGLTPTHARAPRNERAHDRAPFNKGTNHTTLAVLTTAGLAAAMTVAGAADARAGWTYKKNAGRGRARRGGTAGMAGRGGRVGAG